MKARRTVRAHCVALLLVTTALGCGTTDAGYGPERPSETSSGGAGGTGGSGSATSTGGATSTGTGSECAGQCVPLGPGEWMGPMLLWIGKEGEAVECPPTAPIEGGKVFADLNAPNVCDTCKCEAPSGSCALPTTLTAVAATCGGDGPGVPHTYFDAPAGWSGSCVTENSIPANQKCSGVNCVQSLTIAPLTLTESPCAVATSPVASKLPYSWGTVATTCRGAASGPCATLTEVCTPPAPSGFEQCLLQQGDNECPAAYPNKHVFYKGFTDARSCTPCECGAPVGSTCTSYISAFKDGSCSSPVVAGTVTATQAFCADVLPAGSALGSKFATAPIYAPGACESSGGEPVGEAVPEEPTTFCCLPPGM